MIYCTTHYAERIAVHPENDLNETHFIELTKNGHAPTFFVTCCCDEDWVWEFWMDVPSIYERIKHLIMDAIAECDDIYEVMEILDEIFWEYFEEAIVEEDYE